MNKVLIIGYVWPEPSSSAAGARMMQLIRFFTELDYKVTFATTATKTEVMEDLSHLGLELQKIELNNPSFDRFLTELQPNIVLFDRFMMEEQFGWRVSEICPTALKILDTEDLHFIRNARETAFKKGISEELVLAESDLAKREIASIYRCDLSLIISEAEMQVLEQVFGVPKTLLLYLPFMLDLQELEASSIKPDFEDRKDFISIGNFRHAPNWDAVLNLKQNIWPLIREKLPESRLHIYGAYAPEKAFQLQNKKEGFFVHGRAASALEVLRESRVLLAPLRFGAGLKGKFIDAMLAGTPAISTSVGAEGMFSRNSDYIKIADLPSEFAEAAIQLYLNQEDWQKARKSAKEILMSRFEKSLFEPVFYERIQDLQQNLDQYRQKNFIGKMLLHHSINSTRYLSKYIEEKQRNRDKQE